MKRHFRYPLDLVFYEEERRDYELPSDPWMDKDGKSLMYLIYCSDSLPSFLFGSAGLHLQQ